MSSEMGSYSSPRRWTRVEMTESPSEPWSKARMWAADFPKREARWDGVVGEPVAVELMWGKVLPKGEVLGGVPGRCKYGRPAA